MDFGAYREVMRQLKGKGGAKRWEMLITATDIRNAMKGCMLSKSPGLDDVPYELYFYIPELFGAILADIYHKWLENKKIPSSVSRRIWTMLKKNPIKANQIENFRPITLRLSLVVERLIGNAQMCQHK